MNPILLSVAVAGTGAMMYVEYKGARVFPAWAIHGDVKRETRFFAQYGQGACAAIVAAIMWRLDTRTLDYGFGAYVPLLGAVWWSAVCAYLIKKMVSRVRPKRHRAGEFLGAKPGLASWRESFPSTHAACATAMTVVLAHFYPEAALVFWSLCILCALLRYLMEAHWPSDILAGFSLGYCMGWTALATTGGL
jgi:membrane-associated phospholipid phosphatase